MCDCVRDRLEEEEEQQFCAPRVSVGQERRHTFKSSHTVGGSVCVGTPYVHIYIWLIEVFFSWEVVFWGAFFSLFYYATLAWFHFSHCWLGTFFFFFLASF